MLMEFLAWVETHYDIDYAHQALRNKVTSIVIQREIPQEYQPLPKKTAKRRPLQYPVLAQTWFGGKTFSKRAATRPTQR